MAFVFLRIMLFRAVFSHHPARWQPLAPWLAALILVFATCVANAQVLRWATPGDIQTLDPHAQNDSLSNAVNAHFYERLVSRDDQLRIVPGLAKHWQQINPLTWRFTLQPGVRFHEGQALTAADVVFSVQRAQHPNSAIRQYALALGQPVAIDAHTVEFQLSRPNPVMLDHLDSVFIMSREWCLAHGVAAPLLRRGQGTESHATRQVNGTGPYRLISRNPDQQTVWERAPGYWQPIAGNVERVVMRPMGDAASRSLALINGEIDLLTAPAPVDVPKLARTTGLRIATGVENRVIFLGFDQHRAELLGSTLKGVNPFKDERVRRAVAHAIDVKALQQHVMHGQSQPTHCLLPSPVTCARAQSPAINRPMYSPDLARNLLREAGFAKGFDIRLDCPNNRYANDQALCVAIAAMLAKVDIRVQLTTHPMSRYFVMLEKLESSFYLLGWGGAEADAQPTLEPLMHSHNATSSLGNMNYGRFADAQMDRDIEAIATLPTGTARDRLVSQVLARHNAMTYHLPLHHQMLTWAMRSHVHATPLPDNKLRAWLISVTQ